MIGILRSIRGKLLASTMLLGAAAIAIAVVGLSSMASVQRRLEGIVRTTARQLEIAQGIQINLIDIHRDEKNLIIAQSVEDMTRFTERAAVSQQKVMERLDVLEKIGDDQVRTRLTDFKGAYVKFVETSRKVRDLSLRNTTQQAWMLSTQEGDALFVRAMEPVKAIAERNAGLILALLDEVGGASTPAGSAPVDHKAQLEEIALRTRRAVAAKDMVGALLAIRVDERNLFGAQTPGEREKFKAELAALDQRLRAAHAAITQIASERSRVDLANFIAAYDQYTANVTRVTALAMEDSNSKAGEMSRNESRPLYDAAAAAMQTVVDSAKQAMDDALAQSKATYASARTQMIIVAAIALGVAFLLSLAIFSSVLSSVTELVGSLEELDESETHEPSGRR